jgi:hypothetical protein
LNTRLIWNFEINSDNPLNLENLSEAKDALRWESRFFWGQDEIIQLNGLTPSFLQLSHYEIKHREDRYVLVDGLQNIKYRKDQLLYKPLLQQKESLCGFGKKINLAHSSLHEPLPGTAETTERLLATIKEKSIEVLVHKEALVCAFPGTPTIKLELARLRIDEGVYFSVCIEGRAERLVASITQQILGKRASSDYVHFLKKVLHYDQ